MSEVPPGNWSPTQNQPWPRSSQQPPSSPFNSFADIAVAEVCPQNPNPYAAPVMSLGYAPVKTPSWDGLWRQGKLLVMHRLAPLPDVCVKSNQPTKRRLKRNLSWHHPAVYLLIFLHLIIYLVVALIIQKKATIHIGLSEEWFARRQRTMIVAWSLVVFSVAMFIVGLMQLETSWWAPIMLISSPTLFLAAAIYGLLAARMVSPKRITDDYIFLKGVHRDFLAQLPEWPYNI